MIRTFDPALVNERVREAGQEGDFTELLAEPLHVCLLDDRGGALFAWRGPGIYEVHVFFRVRGRAALMVGREMLDRMRRDHGGRLFWSLIPPQSRHVLVFARLMGWESHGQVQSRYGSQELFSTGMGQCLQ